MSLINIDKLYTDTSLSFVVFSIFFFTSLLVYAGKLNKQYEEHKAHSVYFPCLYYLLLTTLIISFILCILHITSHKRHHIIRNAVYILFAILILTSISIFNAFYFEIREKDILAQGMVYIWYILFIGMAIASSGIIAKGIIGISEHVKTRSDLFLTPEKFLN